MLQANSLAKFYNVYIQSYNFLDYIQISNNNCIEVEAIPYQKKYFRNSSKNSPIQCKYIETADVNLRLGPKMTINKQSTSFAPLLFINTRSIASTH